MGKLSGKPVTPLYLKSSMVTSYLLLFAPNSKTVSINYLNDKPRYSLTAPNCNQFLQLSLTILGSFFDAKAKAKKLICKSIAQELVQV